MSDKAKIPSSWLRRLTPGLHSEHTVGGARIDVSANGTTSVSSGALSEIAIRHYDQMQQKAEQLEEKAG